MNIQPLHSPALAFFAGFSLTPHPDSSTTDAEFTPTEIAAASNVIAKGAQVAVQSKDCITAAAYVDVYVALSAQYPASANVKQYMAGVNAACPPATVALMLTLVGLLAGALQVLFGVLRLGRLIRYMPYPVVSGYLTGVGFIIIGSQVPKLFGAPKGLTIWPALAAPSGWNAAAIMVGVVTAGAAATASGLGVGAIQPFARIPSLKRIIPAVGRRLATVAAAMFVVVAAVASLMILNSRLILLDG